MPCTGAGVRDFILLTRLMHKELLLRLASVSIALARIFSAKDGYSRLGCRGPAACTGRGRRATRRRPAASSAPGRAARRGAMATATLPYLLQLCLMSPQKTVNPLDSVR